MSRFLEIDFTDEKKALKELKDRRIKRLNQIPKSQLPVEVYEYTNTATCWDSERYPREIDQTIVYAIFDGEVHLLREDTSRYSAWCYHYIYHPLNIEGKLYYLEEFWDKSENRANYLSLEPFSSQFVYLERCAKRLATNLRKLEI